MIKQNPHPYSSQGEFNSGLCKTAETELLERIHKSKNLFEAKPSFFCAYLRSKSSGCFAKAGDFSLVTFF